MKPHSPKPTISGIQAVETLLAEIGEDMTREGLMNTPKRVVNALREMTKGYQEDPQQILSTTFQAEYDEMIIIRSIPFWSLCEHHMLPFGGSATIGYIPNGRVVGLSKIARLVHCFAHRLQIQERLTVDIAKAIREYLQPLGVGVVIKASHTCMEMRGVKTKGEMTTSCLLGIMRGAARGEFLRLHHG